MPEKNIYGGSYTIENVKEFYDKYHSYVFVKGRNEYLTEKQIPNGQLLIDLDFRYATEIKERQHNKSKLLKETHEWQTM